ncbi:hypothetical protein GOP47_0017318 [Adiantum capillus-veneris]|uniref:HTH myb-type domain-containing protein n=1 Tax=Adiantum capillus-veneris TaxID=13818 RepID=A0A9D4ZAM9_ADICA|nr:hypothetical protein GOP47_0017318 [Adiantum capillus-veneris]
MGSLTGLSLECRPSGRTSTTCALTSFPLAEDPASRMHRLKDCLSALEEERRKIDAFRRELPLCMQLLHDAIESHKEKLAFCKPSANEWPLAQSPTRLNETGSSLVSLNDRSGADEFNLRKKVPEFPFNCNSEDELARRTMCKPDWMAMPTCASFQGESLNHSHERCQTDLSTERASLQRIQEQAFSTSSKPLFHSKTKFGGAFTPFSRDKHVVHPTPRTGSFNPADLALSLKDRDVSFNQQLETPVSLPNLSNGKPQEIVQQHEEDLAVKGSAEVVNAQNDSPPARKARRCWSPELHRRFVNALQQLGGSQVATPKQIRELMKVEGLTNDEVKSHLQKYRLHTRRPSPPQSTSAQTPQVVVLGGIWVPPEYTIHAAAQQASNLYNTPEQPHLCQAATSQEFYSDMGSVEQMQLQSSTLNGQKLAPAHSQSSPHGSSQFAGHSALGFRALGDTGREESVCDDEGSNSSKGCPQGCRIHEISEVEDDRSEGDSVSGYQSHCTSEDEDSQRGDTELKMV